MTEFHDDELLMDHEYDGIQELDNDLPRWWLHGFYFTIAFAVFYLIYYHFSTLGPSPEQEFLAEMAAAGYRVPKAAIQGVTGQDLLLGIMSILLAVAAFLVSEVLRIDRDAGH